jgi:hypothetical protein
LLLAFVTGVRLRESPTGAWRRPVAIMRRILVLSLLGAGLAACGQASVDDARRAGEAARAAAADANARVADLEASVGHIEDVVTRLQTSTRGMAADVERGEKADLRRHRRLLEATDRLWKSVGRLRDSLQAADEDAAAAASRAADLARDLAVLTKRFDYHLKHSGR